MKNRLIRYRLLWPRKQPEKPENWFKKNSTLIIAISNIVLVAVTIVYVNLTSEISDTAQKQMRLNIDPQISIYSEFRPIILIVEDSTLIFRVKNHSENELSELSLRLRFYYQYMGRNGKEGFVDFNSPRSFQPDLNIYTLRKKSIHTFEIDFSRFLYELDADSGNFYLMDTLYGEGHRTKLNLREDWGSMFSVFDFTYYRKEDGKKFKQQFYFRVNGLPYFTGKVLFFEENNLEEILRINRRNNLLIFEKYLEWQQNAF